jgi:hypothetical protein
MPSRQPVKLRWLGASQGATSELEDVVKKICADAGRDAALIAIVVALVADQ